MFAIPAITEIFIFGMSCFILIFGSAINKNKKVIVFSLVKFTIFFAIILAIYVNTLPLENIFKGEFSHDSLSGTLKIILLSLGFVVFSYTNIEHDADRIVEYYVLALLSIIGMLVMISSSSFLTLFLGLELMSLPIYALVALAKNDTAAESAVKYFIMGAVSSGIMLYGMSIIYGITGSIDFYEIQSALTHTLWSSYQVGFSIALIMIMTGIGFKFALVPFHAWTPDVYSGSPLNATIFLSSLPKLGVYAITFKLFVIAFPILVDVWQIWVLVVAILSIVLGNFAALVQNDIKRLLGYSAIANMGYMFLGFGATTANGYSAALYYLIVYAISSIGAFSVLIAINKKYPLEKVSDLQGLSQRSTVLSASMLLIMFSFAGVPPLAGFFAKLFVLQSLLAVGYYKVVIAALLMAVVGAFYYIRIIRVIYFEEPSHTSIIKLPSTTTFILSLNSLALIFLGIYPGLAVINI